jgi:hypothetical protein
MKSYQIKNIIKPKGSFGFFKKDLIIETTSPLKVVSSKNYGGSEIVPIICYVLGVWRWTFVCHIVTLHLVQNIFPFPFLVST